jgi:hypothetical protein
MKRSLFAYLALTVALLVPGLASAVEQTGKIRGKVTDPDGAELIGVTIEATSSAMQGNRSAESSAKGDYWLTGLPPGLYTVRASLDGFESYVADEIRITIGATLTLNITLGTAEVTESVTVTTNRPVIDTSSSSTGQTITREYLQALPVGRSYQSATRLAPGVTGGANPSAMGGSSRENKWLLDGANTSDPVTGTFSFNFNIDAIEEIEVITGAFRAEAQGAMGALFNVRTRSGSDKLEGGVRVFYQNANWSPKRDAVFVPDGRQIEGSEFDRDSQNIDVNAFIGGPIVKQKAWFFTSLRYIRNQSTALGARSPRVFDGFNLFSKITVSPFPRNRFIVSLTNSPANIGNGQQSFLVDPDAQSHQHQNSVVVTGEWKWFITNAIESRVLISHMKSDVDVTPQPCTWRQDDRFKRCKTGQEEGYIDFITPAVWGRVGSRSRDNYTRYSFNDRERTSARAVLSGFLSSPIGTHEIKGGVEASWVKSEITSGTPGNILYVDRLDDADDPSSTVNWYWVERPGTLNQTNTGSTLFAFVQDTWEPTPGLSIDLGVKYERSVLRNDVGDRIVDFNMVSPVGGFSWDPTRTGRMKIFAGGGVIVDQSRLGISSFLDKNGLGFKLYLGDFFDSNSNYSFDQWSGSTGQSNYEKHDKLTVPRTYAAAAGFEVNLGASTVLGVTGQMKLFRNLWEDDDVNYIYNGGGTNTIGVVNGVQDYFFRLRTPTFASRNWFGLVFQLQRTMFKNLLLDINYTLSMTRGLTLTELTAVLDNPTQRPYEYGWLYSDRPHVVKAAAAYQLPFGLMLGGRFNFNSGSRFDRQYYSDRNSGYANYTAPVGTFDTISPWWSIDMRLTYGLKLPYGRLSATAELTNITNNRQATDVSTSALNSNGEYIASGRQPPMSLELGLGYEW